MTGATRLWMTPLLMVPMPLGTYAECPYDSGGTLMTLDPSLTITIPANLQATYSTRHPATGGHRQIRGVCIRPDTVRSSGSSM
jgi:hypothetical protein